MWKLLKWARTFVSACPALATSAQLCVLIMRVRLTLAVSPPNPAGLGRCSDHSSQSQWRVLLQRLDAPADRLVDIYFGTIRLVLGAPDAQSPPARADIHGSSSSFSRSDAADGLAAFGWWRAACCRRLMCRHPAERAAKWTELAGSWWRRRV